MSSVSKQIIDAIQSRLAGIVGGAATPGGKTFNYTPDKVVVAMFTERCCDDSLNTAWIIEPDHTEHEEETTGTVLAHQHVSIVGLRRLPIDDASPYNADPAVADRATEQSRLEADFMNRFTGSAGDVTLDNLCENLMDGLAPVEMGPDTFIAGWAAIFIHMNIRFAYRKAAL